jgi:creatinine amidohydrolase
LLDLHNTSTEIAAAKAAIAVLGIGAIEQHSYHLPLATDWIWADAVSRLVARELDALLLPALPFSMSQCHGPEPGTVWLRPETLAAVLRDVVRSLREQGIHQVVIVNAHGGNPVLEPAIAELNRIYPDMMVILPEFYGGAKVSALFDHAAVDVHAGEMETSFMLALCPERVGPERVDGVPAMGRDFFDYAYLPRWAPDGVLGVPSAASAEKGRRALQVVAAKMAREVRETIALWSSLRSQGPAESQGQ